MVKGQVKTAFVTLLIVLAFPALAAARTTVSIEFDDGDADQLQAATMLQNHGMAGTFFIVSGRIGDNGNMTLAQIKTLAANGHEIGGHTVSHVDLPTLSDAQATQEICNDRQTLIKEGLAITDFAYPFGDYNAADEQIVKSCGYDSARTIGGVKTPESCLNCDLGETIPPRDPYAMITPNSIQASQPLAEIEGFVTQADGMPNAWVQLVIHHVCSQSSSGCDPIYSIDPATFNSLLDWLQARVNAGLDRVSTVHRVISPPPAPPPVNTVLPGISGTPQQGATLTTSNGSWTNNPTSFTYQWQDDGTSNITGATSASYTARASDVGHRLDVVVTAKNDGGSTAATSAQTALITEQADTIQPMPMTIATSNAGTRGLIETGDSITFTYSEAMKPSSIFAGWNGTSTAVKVFVNTASGDDLSVWDPTGATKLALANPVNLGGAYVKSTVGFAATMVENGSAIKITLGAKASGTLASAAVMNGTTTWTDNTTATDLAGNRAIWGQVTTPGPAF
jgi:Polysaccharide deacetylase